ncbi:MAG: efflux RND transporter permease subunit [Flavobacteriales bacterium]
MSEPTASPSSASPTGSVDPSSAEANVWRKRSGWILIAIGLLTAVAGWRAAQIGFNYDFEAFFPEGQPETAFYLQFREAFSTDNDFILVGLRGENGVFDRNFLQATRDLASALDTVEGVTGVIDPTDLTLPVRDPVLGMVFQRPLLRWEQPEHYATDSAAIWRDPQWVGTLFSEDGRSLALTVLQTPMLSKEGCDRIAAETDAVLAAWQADQKGRGIQAEFHRAGRAHAQVHYVSVMEREVALFVGLGLILLITFLHFAFRTWWGIVIPLTVILLSGLGTLAFMEVTGKGIDIMTVVLPTIIFVVGMSDVVHIITRYLDELRAGLAPFPALRKAFREVGLATFLTSLTTAIGFLTLLSSAIGPIREFGLYTAAGVFIAFGLAFSLLPAVLMRSRAPLQHVAANHDASASPWTPWLSRWFIRILRHRRWILGGTGLLTVASLWLLSGIEVNNYLLEDLREDDPLRQEFNFFEQDFSGVRPYELALRFEPGTNVMAEPGVLAAVDSVETWLAEDVGAGSVLGPASIASTANRLLNGNRPSADRVPEGPELQRLLGRLERLDRSNGDDPAAGWSAAVRDDLGLGRITAKTADLGAKVLAARNAAFLDKVNAHLDNTFETPPFTVEVTGTANLIDLNNRFLASDMVLGLLIAFGIVALIVGLLYRSLRMTLISLVPNVLPLLFIAGFMGALDIDLKVSTSIIFTIAFGIAVDDTLHFLAKYRILLRQGRQPIWALRRTFLATGKAIIITSIILCGGFATLMLSSFEGTFHIGLLVSLTLCFAVVVDLAVLPLLLLPKRT